MTTNGHKKTKRRDRMEHNGKHIFQKQVTITHKNTQIWKMVKRKHANDKKISEKNKNDLKDIQSVVKETEEMQQNAKEPQTTEK